MSDKGRLVVHRTRSKQIERMKLNTIHYCHYDITKDIDQSITQPMEHSQPCRDKDRKGKCIDSSSISFFNMP